MAFPRLFKMIMRPAALLEPVHWSFAMCIFRACATSNVPFTFRSLLQRQRSVHERRRPVQQRRGTCDPYTIRDVTTDKHIYTKT